MCKLLSILLYLIGTGILGSFIYICIASPDFQLIIQGIIFGFLVGIIYVFASELWSN